MRIVLAATVLIAPAAAQQAPEFARDVAPILRERCVECHGPVRTRKGLRLDSLRGLRAGGRSGAAVVAGDAERSLLLQHIEGRAGRKRMPPQGESLAPEQIDALRRWIAAGAPGELEPGETPQHWAYAPLVAPPVPELPDSARPRGELDRLVWERLAREGLAPSAEADRRTLLRRVSLDLTGLPPTPGEVAAFLADPAPDAYERAVERLLASPAFGERWAQWWLDLARYADTKGYEADRRRAIWPYRDWVIHAFAQDLPFDRFTLAQLAGDLLAEPARDDLVATAFHRNTMTNDEGGTDDEEFRVAAVIDRVNTTATVWLGSTLACAQCHDHKYDRFSQLDYYRFFALFDQTADSDRPDDEPLLRLPTPEQEQALARIDAELDALRVAEGDAAKGRREALQNERKGIAVVTVPIMRELQGDARRQTRLLERGSFSRPGAPVAPGVPALLGSLPADAQADRLALARWLVGEARPLVARVVVNRLWEQLFGRGLVVTGDDFGVQGEPPSHPELLEWLALRFIAGGWSWKSWLREIVTSATYRQASTCSVALAERDPDNALLARGARFRLPAETLRDQALAVAGLLSRKQFGPSVMPPQPEGLWRIIYSNDRWVTATGEDRYRRGLYTFWRRTVPHPLMTNFDAPSREYCVVRRTPTNTPLQALQMLNDPVFVEAAVALAREEPELERLFARATCREPSARELARLQALWEGERARFAQDPALVTALVGADGDPALAARALVANLVLNMDAVLTRN